MEVQASLPHSNKSPINMDFNKLEHRQKRTTTATATKQQTFSLATAFSSQ